MTTGRQARRPGASPLLHAASAGRPGSTARRAKFTGHQRSSVARAARRGAANWRPGVVCSSGKCVRMHGCGWLVLKGIMKVNGYLLIESEKCIGFYIRSVLLAACLLCSQVTTQGGHKGLCFHVDFRAVLYILIREM